MKITTMMRTSGGVGDMWKHSPKSPVIIKAALLILVLLLLTPCAPYAGERPPLQFSDDETPKGYVGQLYQAKFHTLNAKTPIAQVGIQTGRLPAGLEIKWGKATTNSEEEYDVTIEGIPEEAGTFPVELYIMCFGTSVSGQGAYKSLIIVIE